MIPTSSPFFVSMLRPAPTEDWLHLGQIRSDREDCFVLPSLEEVMSVWRDNILLPHITSHPRLRDTAHYDDLT